MNHLLPTAFLCLCMFIASAQQINKETLLSQPVNFIQGPAPNFYDSLYQLNLPELTLPENQKSVLLPLVVDNSNLPYLRPVFSQVGASCGQASGIGYNFTYEMNHARNLPADTSVNQYPTHFTYNFENGGYEYFGVSYLHSFEILRKCGCMNVKDYGGLTDGGGRWITGYDLYYNGMFNRIEDVHTIKTNTSKGILTLKNWIYNHLGESATGGVASFYAGSPWNATFLPFGSPEQGSYVMTQFSVPAGHAMTIVGYNDLIRYDYNNDGLFTNNIDINNDGEIDVRDWEIGGFKFVNSYGATGSGSTDSGFCYMMYKTLAEDYSHGGIWNNAVHVLKAKPGYQPLLTMRVKISHNQRSAIKVMAGVSSNPESYTPDHVIDFPIFNYQGGNFPMQGPGLSDTMATIEFGLDITPLLSFTNSNQNARFFLSVTENDPFAVATGSIESFSVIDYSQSSPQVYNCQQVPLEITNNMTTQAFVDVTANFNKVKINNPLPTPFTAGEPYSLQLSAEGGLPPYIFSLDYKYTKLESHKQYTQFEGIKLEPQNNFDSLVAVGLGFEFPFFNDYYDTVYVNPMNGFIQFSPENIPWPYYAEPELLLQSYALIAPLTTRNFNSTLEDEGAWYQPGTNEARFRWMLRKKIGETYIPYEFQVSLTPDGKITFLRNTTEVYSPDQFFSGISKGDKQNFEISTYKENETVNLFNQQVFIPELYPEDLKISSTGLIECKPTAADQNYSVDCIVTDYQKVSDRRKLDLSSGVTATLKLHSGSDTLLAAGEQVHADLVLTNLTDNTFSNLSAKMSISDTFLSPSDSIEIIGNLNANSELVIPGAFAFNISADVPDAHQFIIDLKVSSTIQVWKSRTNGLINSANLKSVGIKTGKPDNGLLQPGEIGNMKIAYTNAGHSTALATILSISLPDPSVTLLSGNSTTVEKVEPGRLLFFDFQVKADENIALGKLIPIVVQLSAANAEVKQDTLYFRIGKMPVLVIDMDVKHESAPVIYKQISDLGYLVDSTSHISETVYEYQSVFISLGKFSDKHIMSNAEAILLTDYLDEGGNIYLESPSFWRDDPKTALQPRFSFEKKNKVHKYDTLSGISGSFSQGMKFANIGYPISMYYLIPVGNAFPVFESDTFTCCIANRTSLYRTIGSLFEFKSMQGANDSSSQAILMQKYLDFFDIKRDVIGIAESGVQSEPGFVHVFPTPAFDKVYISYACEQKHPTRAFIYTMNGSKVIEFEIFLQSKDNSQTFEWNLCDSSGRRVKPGLYLCRIVSGNEARTGKILVK